MFTVYAIKSCVTGRIYIGQTQNIVIRLAMHNSGRVASTRKDRPWQIVKTEYFKTRNESRWFEYQLKQSRGRRLKWLL